MINQSVPWGEESKTCRETEREKTTDKCLSMEVLTSQLRELIGLTSTFRC